MIFGTNRLAAVTEANELPIEVNENYFGSGMLSFMEESVQDELAIFEAAVKSDIDEYLIKEDAELEALNESFIQTAAAKIQEMMKKFMQWIDSVSKSIMEKIDSELVKANLALVKKAETRFNKLDKSKISYKGQYIDELKVEKTSEVQELITAANKAKDLLDSDNIDALNALGELGKDSLSVTEYMKKIVKTTENGDAELVKKHIDMLKLLPAEVSSLKKLFKEAKKEANDVVKAAKTMAKGTKGDDRTLAQAKVKAATVFRNNLVKCINFALGVLKAQTKVARHVVMATLLKGTKAKGEETTANESTDVLIEAMLAVDEYELESSLEELSEGCKKEDCCDDEDDLDDEDEE